MRKSRGWEIKIVSMVVCQGFEGFDPSTEWCKRLTEAFELLRSLRRLQRDYPDTPYLFVTERGGPMTERTGHNIIQRAGKAAALPFPVHPHQLCHVCGYYLAAKGHDTRAIQAYLGHRNIQHTVKYTELSSGRFKNFWQD